MPVRVALLALCLSALFSCKADPMPPSAPPRLLAGAGAAEEEATPAAGGR